MAVIDSISDDFSVTMFMIVHKIVHDFIFFSMEVVNPVITWVCGVIEFSVSEIFMNNWAILFFASAFPKCLECSVSLIRRRLVDRTGFPVVHKVLISRLTFVNLGDMRIVSQKVASVFFVGF